jgi:hypothetical protein
MSFALLSIELEDALQSQGCAVCRLVQEGDQRYIRHFLWEGKNEGHMLLRLKRSLGLCHHHAWLLADTEDLEFKDGLGTATLYDWLLDIAHETLRKARETRTIEAAKRLATSLHPQPPCPACAIRREFAETVLWGLQQFLAPVGGHETIRNLYAKSGGLCLPHLLALLRMTSFPEVVQLLLEVQERTLASLLAELELFQRKHRVGEQAPIGKEQDAWNRALDLLAGRLNGARPPGVANSQVNRTSRMVAEG